MPQACALPSGRCAAIKKHGIELSRLRHITDWRSSGVKAAAVWRTSEANRAPPAPAAVLRKSMALWPCVAGLISGFFKAAGIPAAFLDRKCEKGYTYAGFYI